MEKKSSLLLTIALLAMPAITSGEESVYPKAITNLCNADKYQYLVGMNDSTLDKSKLKEPYRIIYHNTPVTSDVRYERLNITVNKNRKIETVYCG